MTSPLPFALATGNADKAREICEILTDTWSRPLAAYAFTTLDDESVGFVVDDPNRIARTVGGLPVLDATPDVEETGATLEENARIKAQGVGRALGIAAIADDTGLEVDALGGAPGVRAARYAGEHASYDDNVAKLLRELEGVAAPSRTARFATVALAWWPDGNELTVRGEVEGIIATSPVGHNGFGYDPVFVPAAAGGRTFAEMAPDEKHALSHRGRAFRALAEVLPDDEIDLRQD